MKRFTSIIAQLERIEKDIDDEWKEAYEKRDLAISQLRKIAEIDPTSGATGLSLARIIASTAIQTIEEDQY